ncbi:hypothetical protein BDV18DRAFT_163608 [Aspergillus unguis]
MTEITSSEILISNLPTKEVTLAPKQVTVVREIHATIQPGQNEITIIGLDPRVNRDSIRIEGSGPATITDIQTSSVPQREDFDEIYPDSEDSVSEEEDAEEEISEDEEGSNDPELQALQKEIEQVQERVALARSDVKASVAVVQILDDYAKGLQTDQTKDVKKFEEFLNIYKDKRDAEAVRNHRANAVVNDSERELAKLQKQFEKRKSKYIQEQRKASKAIRLSNEKKLRAREQKKKQRERKRSEQQHFWSPNVAQVVVSLDGLTALTPGSSRRSSIVEKVEDIKEAVDVVLLLSYIVPGGSWASRYELQINSPSSSARLTYRAEFRNSSTETWRDSKVTLSTSQASFSGIGTPIPSLDAWNIKIFGDTSLGVQSWNNILEAPKSAAANPFVRATGGGLFGSSASRPPQCPPPPPPSSAVASVRKSGTESFGGFGQSTQQESARSTSLFGAASAASGRRARQGPQHRKPVNSSSTDEESTSQAPETAAGPVVELEDEDEEEEEDADTQSVVSLEHRDSVKQDYGMTTTYELPGRRTLAPSFDARRHVLAELDLKSVTLTYVIVPKHREAAFLRARIKNTSSLTLHPGTVGITVDGSFIGTASLETCGPNVFFNISLGVDPGIEVKYAKPTVKPLPGTKFFNKEDGAKFKRSCWVKNTKSVAVDLVVSDQIPVSDDENVRVRLLQPFGLVNEGDEAPLSLKLKNHGTASLEKNGEVKWTVRLEPREETRLVLEYETKVPSGSNVISG